ncbi:MAG: hypothetical protein JHC87_04205 [Thermoleophilaceae bacterium]|nr:hypothetical protein [Thermoleophilaceae bacterium]
MRRSLLTVTMFALAVGLTGCGSDEQTSPATPPPTPATAAVYCPSSRKPPEAFDANTLIGKSLKDAKQEAAKFSCSIRAVEVGGKPQAATMDFREDRVNVATSDGRVTKVISIG